MLRAGVIIIILIAAWSVCVLHTDTLDAQEQLEVWESKYQVDGVTLSFEGFVLSGSTLGYTWCYGTEVHIYLHRALEGRAVAEAVLWHEFCHAVEWAQKGTLSDHGTPWMAAMLQEPVYPAWSFLCAFPAVGIITLYGGIYDNLATANEEMY